MKEKNSTLSRRNFLKKFSKAAVAGVALPYFVPSSALGKAGFVAPSNRINIGFIGLGIHGFGYNLAYFKKIPEVQVGMLCDVEKSRVNSTRSELAKHDRINVAAKYCTQDFRDILDNRDIDAVVISTPDHWHVPMSVMALRKGKHVFSEKPTTSIFEGEFLQREVEKSGLVYQTGIEDRTIANYVRMLDLARNGYLGKLESSYVTVPCPNMQFVAPREEKIPAGFDYELWTGPAQMAPYQPERCHYNFRWQKMYSIGVIADWGPHMFDIAQLAIDGDNPRPTSVEPLRPAKYLKGLYDTAYDFSLCYEYANGRKIFLESGETCFRLNGEKGWIESAAFPQKHNASSPELLDALLKPADKRWRSEKLREHLNFVDAIRCGKQVYYPASAERAMCFSLHAGSIAMDLNKKLKIDGEHFIGEPRANAMRTREYRKAYDVVNS